MLLSLLALYTTGVGGGAPAPVRAVTATKAAPVSPG